MSRKQPSPKSILPRAMRSAKIIVGLLEGLGLIRLSTDHRVWLRGAPKGFSFLHHVQLCHRDKRNITMYYLVYVRYGFRWLARLFFWHPIRDALGTRAVRKAVREIVARRKT